jgi:plasmid stabilization system protein ParE
MAYSVDISQAAEGDIRNAFLWYEEQKAGLGFDFELHISKAIGSIQSNPLKTQIRYADIRVFFLKKFPYGIHFKVNGSTILIVAVFAAKDDPGKWEKRKG